MIQSVPFRKGSKRRVDKLVDYNDDAVKGRWYPEKIQKISYNQCRIEKVLLSRTLPDGTKELFVWSLGWPNKYKSWIKETDKYYVVDE